MESKSQQEANERWRKHNSKKHRIYSYRSTAKTFIRKYASLKDLKALLNLIKSEIKKF